MKEYQYLNSNAVNIAKPKVFAACEEINPYKSPLSPLTDEQEDQLKDHEMVLIFRIRAYKIRMQIDQQNNCQNNTYCY